MNITIPPDLVFADLDLEREPVTLGLKFLPGSLAELCRFNALNPVAMLAKEDLSCWLIVEWYVAHREAGGEQDSVMEQFVAERNVAQESGIGALQQGGIDMH